MGDTLLRYSKPVTAPDGRTYDASACGAPTPAGTWEGWIEFAPADGGEPIRSPRETTQPNRTDTEYWATGLSAVYLEGALRRALSEPHIVRVSPPSPSMFAEPAPSTVVHTNGAKTSILDPFSVYEKGEPLLRRQLGALSAWHLVNIVLEYELSDIEVETLNRMPAAELVELIVQGVREQVGSR